MNAMAAAIDTYRFDVLIVGAGLSGIGAAYWLQTRCPARRYAILEARDAIGGTWNLFRYPGIRSDSDMYTLGYAFRPWAGNQAIADGATIAKYIRDTASEYGIDKHIRFAHRVLRAAWSSLDQAWSVEVQCTGAARPVGFICNFLYMCTGYYDYASGYTPSFPGTERFHGRIIHPQKWPQDLDCTGQRVVVIGSGATAVTLAPALAKVAAHVTLLQRSPTYILSEPSQDKLAAAARAYLSPKIAYGLIRWRNILTGLYQYRLARRRPEKVKRYLLEKVRAELGEDYDMATHFTPRYNPWDQRLCLVPDSDLFKAIKTGRVDVVTDGILTFTPTGLKLTSGRELPADLVITATGLKMQLLSGIELSVDGTRVSLADTTSYKGVMYSGVPNLATAFGYINASWTLKCDLTAQYVCRLLNHMSRRGFASCVPGTPDATVAAEPWLELNSGYVQRALGQLPRQGSRRPWKLYQNYLLDLFTLRFGSVADGVMRFVRAASARPALAAAPPGPPEEPPAC